MSNADGYEKAVPQIREQLDSYQRVLGAVRESHAGRPIDEVTEALARAFEAEGIEVWNEVIQDAARLISGRPEDRSLS
jgi:hypothetical protein